MPAAITQSETQAWGVRLLAVDLDGTLLDDRRQLNPESADAIRRASKQGVVVVLASGRIFPSMRPFAKALGLTGPFVCANGGHVIDPSGEELHFHSLNQEARKVIIEFALNKGLHLNAYTRDELLFLQETSWSQVYRSRVRAVIPRVAKTEELLSASISKMMLVGEPSEMAALRSEIEPRLDPNFARVTESEPEYLEFLSPQAHKGSGVAAIAQMLGIRQEETAAIGDYLNDIEMLQWAGISAAVENAARETRAIADVLVESNENGGVARFIDSYVLNRQE